MDKAHPDDTGLATALCSLQSIELDYREVVDIEKRRGNNTQLTIAKLI